MVRVVINSQKQLLNYDNANRDNIVLSIIKILVSFPFIRRDAQEIH